MTKNIPMLSLAVSLAAFGFGPAFAQSTSGSNSAQTPAGSHSGGVTTGPASPSGEQTTLGTGGVTPTTRHQTEALRAHGGRAVTAEHRGQHGGTRRHVRPGKPDTESGTPSHQAPAQQ